MLLRLLAVTVLALRTLDTFAEVSQTGKSAVGTIGAGDGGGMLRRNAADHVDGTATLTVL